MGASLALGHHNIDALHFDKDNAGYCQRQCGILPMIGLRQGITAYILFVAYGTLLIVMIWGMDHAPICEMCVLHGELEHGGRVARLGNDPRHVSQAGVLASGP